MIRFKLVSAFAAMMLVLALAAAGFTQNKPLKKIRVGVLCGRHGQHHHLM